jgi:hypothetical protein
MGVDRGRGRFNFAALTDFVASVIFVRGRVGVNGVGAATD